MTGFFEQYYIACFKPSGYNTLLKKKKAAQILYVVLLIFLLVFIESGIPFLGWDISVGGLNHFITERIPAFRLSDGELTIETPIVMESDAGIRLVVDSDVEKYTEDDFEDDYTQEALLGQKNAMVKQNGQAYEIDYAALGDLDADNGTLLSMLPLIYVSIALTFGVLLAVRAVQYLVMAFFFSLICRGAVRSMEGKTVTRQEAFRAALYAGTMAAILESVNTCLGGLLNGTILLFVTVILTMFYLFKGEASILFENAPESR